MSDKLMNGSMLTMQTTMLTIKGTAGVTAMATAQAAGAGTASAMSAGASAAYPGPMRFFIIGVVFSAQTGVDYRKLKKGEITRDEFK